MPSCNKISQIVIEKMNEKSEKNVFFEFFSEMFLKIEKKIRSAEMPHPAHFQKKKKQTFCLDFVKLGSETCALFIFGRKMVVFLF